ncbi:8669_t:CDS:2, partial [Gigaspora margarita]
MRTLSIPKISRKYNTISASRNKISHPEAYTSLLKVYQEANSTKKKDIAIREAQSLWNKLRKKLEKRLFFIKAACQSQEHITDNTTDNTSKKRETPAQTKLKKELIRLNQELSQLQDLEDKDIVKVLYVKKNDDSDLTFKQTYRIIDCGTTGQNLIHITAKLSTCSVIRVTKCCGSNTPKLLGLITDAASKRKKVVQNESLKLQQVEDQLKAAGINTQLIKPVGCPRLEEAQPGLLETILRLVSSDRQISYLATYLRLLQKWFNTKEGKRHVKTVPVKLLRSQNTARKRYEDTHFCASLVRNIKEMISLLGPQSVLTIFQDDKARIHLGLAAANKQAPILMRVEYRVELPNHDWVIAEKYKLIPSVYAILEIQS